MNIKLLTEHHLEFLGLKGGCTDSSESIHIKMPHCWKSHVAAQIMRFLISFMRDSRKFYQSGSKFDNGILFYCFLVDGG